MNYFKDRKEAGQKLAEVLKKKIKKDFICFAIPNGGVIVGKEIAEKLEIPLRLMIVRKILYPFTTEAGFGAIDPEGKIIFREVPYKREIIEKQIAKAKESVKERLEKFKKWANYEDLKNKKIILTDDGLASGYTMLSGIKFLKRKNVKKIIVAVPCASISAIDLIKPEVDELISIFIKKDLPFAVADFYQNWYDVSDEEVIKILKN
ncbi:MAG: phosphoribosyltransferase [Patescibacteria group bacterium]